jgi:hypothetical protein
MRTASTPEPEHRPRILIDFPPGTATSMRAALYVFELHEPIFRPSGELLASGVDPVTGLEANTELVAGVDPVAGVEGLVGPVRARRWGQGTWVPAVTAMLWVFWWSVMDQVTAPPVVIMATVWPAQV